MSNELAIVSNTSNSYLTPATDLSTVLATYQVKREFINQVLREGTDYGKIPGTGDKPALLKPGAEKMASFFGLSPVFEDVETVEDWTGEHHNGEPFFYYRQKCKLYLRDRMIASADGSCNSWEKKYRYRNADLVCPSCGKPNIRRSKDKTTGKDGGWYCWNKTGGCGATFPENDKRISEQPRGQVKNPDVAEAVNTILKMAQKRALVAATLIGTNASDYFTQDVEDYAPQEVVDAVFSVQAEASSAPAPKPAAKPAQTTPHAPVMPPAENHAPVDDLAAKWPADAKVSYEMAQTVVDSKGNRYLDIDTEKLSFMVNAIDKKLRANGMTEDERAETQLKRDTAATILKARATN